MSSKELKCRVDKKKPVTREGLDRKQTEGNQRIVTSAVVLRLGAGFIFPNTRRELLMKQRLPSDLYEFILPFQEARPSVACLSLPLVSGSLFLWFLSSFLGQAERGFTNLPSD